MPLYSSAWPRLQTWAVGLALGSAAGLGYVGYETYASRRCAVPVFDPTRVIRTEECARYRCAALAGMDVVVTNYYAREDSDERVAGSSEVLFVSAEELADIARHEASLSSFSLARLRGFLRLFRNDAHGPDAVGCITSGGPRVLRDTDDISSVRQIVSTGGRDATRALVASSTWPPGTAKYAALVLEQSSRAPSSESASPVRAAGAEDSGAEAAAAHLQNPLRWLTDRATHQSLVRCQPLSALTDMNCEADPAYLGATYLRVMLSAFLLLPSAPTSQSRRSTALNAGRQHPLRVGVLGVGGGSLPHFLLRYFQHVLRSMDLVDIEPMCFKAAAEQLGVRELAAAPQDGPVVRAHAQDARQFLRERVQGASQACAHTPRGTSPVFPPEGGGSVGRGEDPQPHGTTPRPFDLLFVDLFVGSELAGEVESEEFLALCRNALSSYGVAAFNLPAPNKEFLRSCQRFFGRDNVYSIPVPATSNVVVLARGGVQRDVTVGDGDGSVMFTESLPHLSQRVLYRRAQQLQETYRLPYDLANHFPVWWRYW